MINGFEKLTGKNPHVFERANMLLLSMISVFDETGKNNPKRNLLYNTSLSLAKWLMEKDNNEDWQIVYKLNYYQILKR